MHDRWKTCSQNSPWLILENLILTPVKAVVSTGGYGDRGVLMDFDASIYSFP